MSGSGIVTGMGTPGTYRVSDGSRVEFAAALAAWTAAAVPVLERVACTYHATISYKDLGEEVQHVTGIRTRVLLMNWIGQVLGGVSRISHRRGQPMLSALCVHSDGTVGGGVRPGDPGQLRRPAAGRPRHARRGGTVPLLQASARTCHPAGGGLR